MKTFIINTWEWFKTFFNEDNGASTTRALNWIWLILMSGCISFTVIFNALKTGHAELPVIDGSYVTLSGLFLAAKVGQRIWGENPSTVTPETPKTV